jgi:flagellar biosynthesis protein FlhA
MLSALQQQGDSLNLSLPAEFTMEINQALAQAWKQSMDQGRDKIVLICDSRLRLPLATMTARTVPPLSVLAYDEIVPGTEVEAVETIAPPEGQISAANEPELVSA